MWTGPTDATLHSLTAAVQAIDIAGDELDGVIGQARGLSAATDWQAEAARGFYRAAEEWSSALVRLTDLVADARLRARQAVDIEVARRWDVG